MKKNILESNFLKEMMSTTSNMYRLGWDEKTVEISATYLETMISLSTLIWIT